MLLALRNAALALFAGSMAAFCAPLTFSVNGTFNDGSTFSGTFQMDGAALSIVSSNVTTTPDTPNFTGYQYISSGSGAPWVDNSQPGQFSVEFQDVPLISHIFF